MPFKPTDGPHRAPDPYRAWCQNLFNSLKDGGSWGVPRSLLTFEKHGAQLVLTHRGDYEPAADQQRDFELIRKQFASAGIEVLDATTKPSTTE